MEDLFFFFMFLVVCYPTIRDAPHLYCLYNKCRVLVSYLATQRAEICYWHQTIMVVFSLYLTYKMALYQLMLFLVLLVYIILQSS